jgi:hypothetical protein
MLRGGELLFTYYHIWLSALECQQSLSMMPYRYGDKLSISINPMELIYVTRPFSVNRVSSLIDSSDNI